MAALGPHCALNSFMSVIKFKRLLHSLCLSIISTCVFPSLVYAQMNACIDFYNLKAMQPAEIVGLASAQKRSMQDFIDKGYEFKIRKYLSKVPPRKMLDFFVVTKYPPGTMIERLARSIKHVTGVEIVFDFSNHHSGNRGSIDFSEKLIFLSPQNLSTVDGLPTPTLLHELHHVMNRYLSFFRRDINLGNALFRSSDSLASTFQRSLRGYAKIFYLDELSAARLTDRWRQKSADPESNLFGSDETSYAEPQNDLKPISDLVFNALKEKRYTIESTHVEAFNTPQLIHHGQTDATIMPMTKTYLKLYTADGTILGSLDLELPRLVAMKMLGMSPEQQSQKKWSKFLVEKEIEAFTQVLERQLKL